MDLETSRTLGGIGALLMFIMPFVGVYTAALGLIGLILVLIAMKGLADSYNEQGIFNNALYGLIIGIVGIVVSIAILFFAVSDLFITLGITNWADWQILRQINFSELMDFSILWNFLTYLLVAGIVHFVFIIIAAIFLRRSLNSLSAKTGVGLFGTTGLLILIGAVLTIIAVGLLIIWIGLILLAVAFFSVKPRAAQPAAPPPQ